MLLVLNRLKLCRFSHTWIKPEGFNTGIKVYNCITRTKEPLIVRNKNLVTWYTCGPTVYASAHLGHASCYVKLDIIQRILEKYYGLNLVTVMNITDIDDKIIRRSNEEKVDFLEVAKHYEKEFWTDLKALNVKKPNVIIRVSENIEFITSFIKKLVEKEQAYKSSDNSVYFDVANYKNYGKLSNVEVTTESQESEIKRNLSDFVLWKARKEGEPFWDSSFGPGRPGWHIECSALATYLLGSCIDFHAGGIDLKFPHHENEEAQSCCYHSRHQWVNYWIHTGHLHLGQSEKMSKSLGNVIKISDLLKTNETNVFRIACAMSHYRSGMEFSIELMETANNVLKNYKNFVSNCRDYLNGNLKFNLNETVIKQLLIDSYSKINEELSDDFNTPFVVNSLNNIVSTFNSMSHSAPLDDNFHPILVVSLMNLVENTLHLFGIELFNSRVENNDNFAEVMNILNSFRQDIRQLGISTKNTNLLNICDQVRDNLSKIGISVKDRGKMSSWSV